jgi:hypothetical protein
VVDEGASRTQMRAQGSPFTIRSGVLGRGEHPLGTAEGLSELPGGLDVGNTFHQSRISDAASRPTAERSCQPSGSALGVVESAVRQEFTTDVSGPALPTLQVGEDQLRRDQRRCSWVAPFLQLDERAAGLVHCFTNRSVANNEGLTVYVATGDMRPWSGSTTTIFTTLR